MLVFPWKQEHQHNDAVIDTCLQEVATLRVSTVSRICSTLWLKLQRKSPKHLLQPGIIYKHLSILKAEQLALIEGRELWVEAGRAQHPWPRATAIPTVPRGGLWVTRFPGPGSSRRLG